MLLCSYVYIKLCITVMELSYWENFSHCLYHKLSIWKLLMYSVTKISSRGHFLFGDDKNNMYYLCYRSTFWWGMKYDILHMYCCSLRTRAVLNLETLWCWYVESSVIMIKSKIFSCKVCWFVLPQLTLTHWGRTKWPICFTVDTFTKKFLKNHSFIIFFSEFAS